MKPGRVLITGGSGFIGTNYVEHCLKHGISVRNLDICTPINPAHRDSWKQISILDAAAVTSEFQKFRPEHIVHLAARTDLDGKTLSDYRANIDGMRIVAEAAISTGCRRIVLASTKLVNRNGYCPEHDCDYNPDTLYGESKVRGEKLLREIEFGDVDWAIVRPTSIWGPWSDLPHIPYGRFFQMIEQGRFFHIRNLHAPKVFGYVGNTIAQIDSVLSAPDRLGGRVFYLADYQRTHIPAWAELIRKEYGAPPIRTVPLTLARAGAMLGDIVKLVSGRDFPITGRRLKNMALDTSQIPLDSIRELCPDLPFTIEDGVRETVQWFRNRQAIRAGGSA